MQDANNLVCTDPQAVDVKCLHFSKDTEGSIKVSIKISHTAPDRIVNNEVVSFASSLAKQLRPFIIPSLTRVNHPIEGTTLKAKIDVSTTLLNLDGVINVLEGKMHEFPANMDQQLRDFVSAERSVLVATSAAYREQRVNKAEGYAENTMTSGIVISVMQSEESLRDLYYFPAPNYSRIHTYIQPTALADYELDIPAHANENPGWDKYTAAENSAIEDLIKNLKQLASQLKNTRYLTEDNIDGRRHYRLSNSSIYLLQNYNVNDDALITNLYTLTESPDNLELFADIIEAEADISAQKDKARIAHDVIVALNELKPGGSYSHNGLISESKIRNYGIRNIVALLWHACCTAGTFMTVKDKITKIETERKMPDFINGNKFERSTLAEIMARAIANGARGGNRDLVGGDNTVYKENIYSPNSPVCGQGKLNLLFDAFISILCGINLIYDLPDLFTNEVECSIFYAIFKVCKLSNHDAAIPYLRIWNGEAKAITSTEQADYRAICTEFERNLPNLKQMFITKQSQGKAELAELIKAELDRRYPDLNIFMDLSLNPQHARSAFTSYDQSLTTTQTASTSFRRPRSMTFRSPPPPPPYPPPTSSSSSSAAQSTVFERARKFSIGPL